VREQLKKKLLAGAGEMVAVHWYEGMKQIVQTAKDCGFCLQFKFMYD
jgi:hypothetical protein